MAKKKLELPPMEDWIEVDGALRRMAEIDIERGKLEGKMTIQMNEIREKFAAQTEVIDKEREQLEAAISVFAEERKPDFLRVRTREMNFGTLSYRVVKKLMIRSTKAVVAAMKVMGLAAFLRVKEEPDKEKMEALSDQDLAKIGVSRKCEDKLTITPNIEKIKAEAA